MVYTEASNLLRMSARYGFLLIYSCSLTACFSDGIPFLGQRLPAVIEAPVQNVDAQTNENSQTKGLFSADSSRSQLLEAPAGGVLSKASVLVLPGSLSISTEITLEPGTSLSGLGEELGVTGEGVVSQSAALAVTAVSSGVTLSLPMTVAISLGDGLSLQEAGLGLERLAIFFLVKKDGLTMAGMIPGERLRRDGGLILFETLYFGVYQVMKVPVEANIPKMIVSTKNIITEKEAKEADKETNKGTIVTADKPPLSEALSFITISGRSTLRVGDTALLSVLGTYLDGSTRPLTQEGLWSSSDPSVATVNELSGEMRAIKPGIVTITLTKDKKTASLKVTLEANNLRLTLSCNNDKPFYINRGATVAGATCEITDVTNGVDKDQIVVEITSSTCPGAVIFSRTGSRVSLSSDSITKDCVVSLGLRYGPVLYPSKTTLMVDIKDWYNLSLGKPTLSNSCEVTTSVVLDAKANDGGEQRNETAQNSTTDNAFVLWTNVGSKMPFILGHLKSTLASPAVGSYELSYSISSNHGIVSGLSPYSLESVFELESPSLALAGGEGRQVQASQGFCGHQKNCSGSPGTIQVGAKHACAISGINGQVSCWGTNVRHSLSGGAGDTDYQIFGPRPVLKNGVSPLENASLLAVSKTGSHSCAVFSGGTLKCWGANESGQLGNGLTFDTEPTDVCAVDDAGSCNALLSGVTAIAAGRNFTCAVTGGQVACFGSNTSNILGNNTDPNIGSSVPVWVKTPADMPLTGAVSVSAGDQHACALLANGDVYCWGDFTYGQGSQTGFANRILTLPIASQIASGSKHNCAVLTSGLIWCWGYATAGGQVPTQVSSITNVVAVSGGEDHTCALLKDGSTLCWGTNIHGQLGTGTLANLSTPDPLEKILAVGEIHGGQFMDQTSLVAAGKGVTCVLRLGEVYCFGEGAYGVTGFGAGNISDKLSPTSGGPGVMAYKSCPLYKLSP